MNRVWLAALVVSACACAKTYSSDPGVDAGLSAAVDAQASVDADARDAGTSSCASTFCDDFERASVLGGWTRESVGAGGSIIVDAVHAHSGAQSLHVEFPAGASTSGSYLVKDQPAKLNAHTTYAFWFFAPPETRHADIATLYVNGDTESLLVLSLINNALGVGRQTSLDGTTYEGMTDGADVPAAASAWHEVRVDANLAASGTLVTVMLDGASVQLALGGMLRTVDNIVGVSAQCGVDYAASGDAFDIWYDDVTFGVTP